MRSGLQQEVIHLYRRALRIVRTKPEHTRPKFLLLIRHAFRAPTAGGTGQGTVSPRDFGTIEFLLRKGKKQVEMWSDPSVRDCWVSEDMQDWERRETSRWRK